MPCAYCLWNPLTKEGCLLLALGFPCFKGIQHTQQSPASKCFNIGSQHQIGITHTAGSFGHNFIIAVKKPKVKGRKAQSLCRYSTAPKALY